MNRLNIDIFGSGPHVIISPDPGKKFLIDSMLLTFAHQHAESQPVTFYSGDTLLYGPYLVFDGEKVEWKKDPTQKFDIKPGEAFKIGLADGVRCGASIEYEVGVW